MNWERDTALIRRNGQIRLKWDVVIVNLFFATFEFLDAAAQRIQFVPFAGRTMPILSAEDLTICKVAFNRDKDWLDPRELVRIQGKRLDRAYIDHWLAMFGEDPRVERFHALLAQYG